MAATAGTNGRPLAPVNGSSANRTARAVAVPTPRGSGGVTSTIRMASTTATEMTNWICQLHMNWNQ